MQSLAANGLAATSKGLHHVHAMRVSRAGLGLALAVAVAVTTTIVARTTDPPVATSVETLEPQFFSWSGEPFEDDLNHYVAVVDPGPVSTEFWLELRDDSTLVAGGVPDELLVAVDDIEATIAGEALTDAAVVETIAEREDVNEVRPIGFGIYAISGRITPDDLAILPGVVDVARDVAVEPATVDPYFPSQWGLDNDGVALDPWQESFDADIDAPGAWHRTRGAGVIVAVVDSGVDIGHADLTKNVWTNPGELCGNGVDDDGNGYVDDCHGWDFANGDATVDDHIGHGTHVAGIIAAEADNGIGIAGVAYEAEIMPVKIGEGAPALSAALEGIAYAIDNGARVINASWGVDDPAAAPYIDAALAAAEQAGVLVVTAAGNEPVNIDVAPVYPASSDSNAVIAVGASTATDGPASFSAYGPDSVDVFAPGEYIISTIPGGYGIYSGTSMAAPMVSGAAALLWAASPAATAAEVKGALLDGSDGPNDGVTAFRGRAVSEGRLNIDASIYSRLFQPPLMYTFYDFNSFEPDTMHNVSVVTKTVDPWRAPPQTSVQYRVGLYVPLDGAPMAVVGHQIGWDSGSANGTATTDDTGRALVGKVFEPEEISALVQDGDSTILSMALPAGTYALVTEMVALDAEPPPLTLGDPSAVFFVVDDEGSITPMPGTPIGGQPVPTTTPPGGVPTTAPEITTIDPATTTTSTTLLVQPPQSTTTTPPPTSAPPTTPPPTTSSPVTTTLPVATTTTAVPAPPTTTSLATTTTGAPAISPTTTPPSTTAPPTTGAPTPTTAPPTTILDDMMRVSSINPTSGPTVGGTLVSITGTNLPDDPEVFFGDRGARIILVAAPTFIVVNSPAGAAGSVSITVADRSGRGFVTLPGAFTYVDSDGSPPPSVTIPPVPTTTPWPTTTPPTTTGAPPVTTTTVIWPTTTFVQPSTTSTTSPVTPQPPSLDDWVDGVLRTPDGLTLAPPAADDPIASLPVSAWVGALCDEPVCPGWVLER
jgi:serine protease